REPPLAGRADDQVAEVLVEDGDGAAAVRAGGRDHGPSSPRPAPRGVLARRRRRTGSPFSPASSAPAAPGATTISPARAPPAGRPPAGGPVGAPPRALYRARSHPATTPPRTRLRAGMVGLGMIFDDTYRPLFEQLHAEGLYRRDFGPVEAELSAVASRTGARA